MSISAQNDIVDNKFDELDETRYETGGEPDGGAQDNETNSPPTKRGRGRPKGSKNKRTGVADTSADVTTTQAADAGSSVERPKKKRGRPPKEKKGDESGGEGTPPPKRKRGRPPKNPKPETTGEGGTSGEGGETSVKKKRGRPPKKA